MGQTAKYLGIGGGVLLAISNTLLIFITWDILSKFASSILVLPPLIICSYVPALAGVVGGLVVEKRPVASAVMQVFAGGVALWFGLTGAMFLFVAAAIVLILGAVLAAWTSLAHTEPLAQTLLPEDMAFLFRPDALEATPEKLEGKADQ